jgi:hypothetical protein
MIKSASQSDGTIDQINELTSKIDEMTKGIAKLTNQNGENPPPPLPQKRTQRQQSMYDNVTDSGINLSSRMEARMSSSSVNKAMLNATTAGYKPCRIYVNLLCFFFGGSGGGFGRLSMLE